VDNIPEIERVKMADDLHKMLWETQDDFEIQDRVRPAIIDPKRYAGIVRHRETGKRFCVMFYEIS
jgi:Mg2+/Co2+ transporter CorC